MRRGLRPLLLLAALVAAAPAFAQRFISITPDRDAGDDLVAVDIRLGKTIIIAPHTEKGQLGFAATKISADGRYAGWAPLLPNCCATYPMTTLVVVMDTKQRLHRFPADSALWDWAFVESLDAVALLSAPMHGPSSFEFDLYAINSGKKLAAYACEPNPDDPGAHPPADMPDWARSISGRADCQTTVK